MEKARAHVFISGLVQGVFFRWNTKKMADKLQLSGWVRNLPDGRVEAIFEGNKESIEKMIEWCKKGPSEAIVEKVEIIWEEYKSEYKGFKIV
ncbi:MAG: acylphosphatase, partial [Nitrososphaerota archaeon]